MISNLSSGTDRAAICSGTSSPRDGDCWRDPCDGITIRLVQSLKKLSRVGGETLDVATLSLGVERVECQ